MFRHCQWLLSNIIPVENNKAHLYGIVEEDESLLGGKRENKHAKKRQELVGPIADKMPVAGANQRGGGVVVRSGRFIDKGTLIPFADDSAERSAHVFTEENTTYNTLEFGNQHFSVCHAKGKYGCGPVSTNAMESFPAYMKRVWAGTYHWWSRKRNQR